MPGMVQPGWCLSIGCCHLLPAPGGDPGTAGHPRQGQRPGASRSPWLWAGVFYDSHPGLSNPELCIEPAALAGL